MKLTELVVLLFIFPLSAGEPFLLKIIEKMCVMQFLKNGSTKLIKRVLYTIL